MIGIILRLIRYRKIEKLTQKELGLQKHMKRLLEKIDHLFHDPGNVKLAVEKSNLRHLSVSLEAKAEVLQKIAHSKKVLKEEIGFIKAKDLVIEECWADLDKTMDQLLEIQTKKKKLYFKLR